MATPRREIVESSVPSLYHCMSRCVQGLDLLGGTFEYRQPWIEETLFKLAKVMAIDLVAHSILPNHFHLLLKIRPDIAKRWKPREIARRYLMLYPTKRENLPEDVTTADPPTAEEIDQFLQTTGAVKTGREALSSLSVFMGKLKHPISCRANAEAGTKGCFWDGRFRSIRVLDEHAFLGTCLYIDLNPLRAGLVKRVEDSKHASVCYRIEKFLNRCPPEHEERAALLAELQGISIGEYLRCLDRQSRRMVEGKYSVPEHEASIEDRLGISSEQWDTFIKANLSCLRGTAIGTQESMERERKRRGLERMWNTLTNVKKR